MRMYLQAGLCLAMAMASSGYAQASQAADDRLVVSRGKAEIRFSDIDARLMRVPEAHRAAFMDSPERIDTTLNSMLLAKQLAAEAREEGLDQDPIIAAELRLAQDEVLAKRRIEQVVKHLEYPDFRDLAYERYISSPSLFTSPAEVDVRHFLIKREIHGDEAARAKAEALRAEFVESGGDFEAFVKQHSEEPRADEHGGKLAGVTPGQTVGAFEEAAFDLEQPGELSPVVSTRFGYHVIQLIDKRDGTRQSFEQVRPQIEETLRDEYLTRAKQRYIEELRASPMQASPELVKSLRSRYLPEDSPLRAQREAGPSSPDAGDSTRPGTGSDE